jgi:hypothetical protein
MSVTEGNSKGFKVTGCGGTRQIAKDPPQLKLIPIPVNSSKPGCSAVGLKLRQAEATEAMDLYIGFAQLTEIWRATRTLPILRIGLIK